MDLSAKTREITGKKVRALRREGLVPAELYGHGLKNMHLTVPAKEFSKIYKEAGTTTIINLVVGTEKKPALVYDVKRDYLTGDVEHVDFYQVRMDEKITAKVPLEFIGDAPAVKAYGAVLNKSMTEIEVEALPKDLPHSLTVDLSMLTELNKSVYVRDVALPRGVKVLVDAETAVATATPQAAEEITEAPVNVADVKVESDEKKAERAAEKAEKKTE